MTKTVEELKKAIRCCATPGHLCYGECPYNNRDSKCIDKEQDTLAYIEYLEAEIEKLKARNV